jgi:hypothetical protein
MTTNWEYITPFDELDEEGNPVELPIEWIWERLRLKRDTLLKKCDYRIVADAPWDTQPWLEYRQALRDLPKTNKDPKKIVFPTRPEE